VSRHAKAADWLLVLLIPLLVCVTVFADEGSVKTQTRFLPKPDEDPLIESALEGVKPTDPEVTDPIDDLESSPGAPATSPGWQGMFGKRLSPQSMSTIVRTWTAVDAPPVQSPGAIAPPPLTATDDEQSPSTGFAPPSVVVQPPASIFDLEVTESPLTGMIPTLWTPLAYVNAAIPKVLAKLETRGCYSGLKSDIQTVSTQFNRYVRGQTVNGQNASTIVEALKELRAAAADLREIAKDEKAIAELYAKAQPSNPQACPSANRGCQAIQRIANVLKNWETIAGATSDPGTTSDLRDKLTGVFTDFFSRTEATSRWVYDRARELEEIRNRVISTTKPVDGTTASFGDWQNKVGLVVENLQWAKDHAGDANDLSAVTFGLEMAKGFKEDLEGMHEVE